jgi:hypothetical protein
LTFTNRQTIITLMIENNQSDKNKKFQKDVDKQTK